MVEHEFAYSSIDIEKAILAKRKLFEVEGMDEDTLYRMCRVIDEGILVITNILNKKYKTEVDCAPYDFIGMTKEEYDSHI